MWPFQAMRANSYLFEILRTLGITNYKYSNNKQINLYLIKEKKEVFKSLYNKIHDYRIGKINSANVAKFAQNGFFFSDENIK